jgi:tagatose 6-phosphate kinase
MILCVTPNPAVERTWIIPGLKLGEVFRVQEYIVLASGKGINVARAMRILGEEPLCMGLLAGNTGRLIESLAEQEGLKGKWTWIEGESRVAVVMVDPQNPECDATLISEAGPSITENDWRCFSAEILDNSTQAKLVCFSGSFPRGTPMDEFGNLIQQLESAGKPVWVDCGGVGLAMAVQSQATGIKVNISEASSLVKFPVSTVSDASQAGVVLRRQGVKYAMITLGEAGAVLVSEEGVWWSSSPKIERLSSVGSGDAFFAGFIIQLAHGVQPAEALKFATAAGAANALSLGGGLLKREDFNDALGQVKVERIV